MKLELLSLGLVQHQSHSDIEDDKAEIMIDQFTIDCLEFQELLVNS
jgi:hypothetical protein